MTHRSSISPTYIGKNEVGDLEEGEDELFGEDEAEKQKDEEPVEVDAEQNQEVEFRQFETSITPNAVADPGAPSAREVAEHNVTHLPHRSWCPICIEARGRDRQHRRVDRSSHEVPELHFDYAFLGTKDETETQAVQVGKETKYGMLFAHHVPKKGLASTHGAREINKDLDQLGFEKTVLKSDGEAALKAIQAEVARTRTKDTILENSPVGDSKANGLIERAIQGFAEQFRTVRGGLQQRLGVRLPGNHPLTSWMCEHAANLLNQFRVGEDGKTAWKRWKGKDFGGQIVEFGEKVHHRSNVKFENGRNKMDARWFEGFYMGTDWRSGSALIGTSVGVVKASVIRRVGEHRRWDAQGVLDIKGTPWNMRPSDDDEDQVPGVIMQQLPPGELHEQPEAVDQRGAPRRMMLKKEDYVRHGFTEHCQGCRALLAGRSHGRHSEACRTRMEKVLRDSPEGQERFKRARDRIDEEVTRQMEEHLRAQQQDGEDAGHSNKKQKRYVPNQDGPSVQGGENAPSSSSASGQKRRAEDQPEIHQDHKVRVTEDEQEGQAKLTDEQMDEMFGPDWATLTSMRTDLIETPEENTAWRCRR